MKNHWIAALSAIMIFGICDCRLANSQVSESASPEAGAVDVSIGNVAAVPSRVVQRVDETKLAMLRGNTHPLARAEFDRGRVDPQLPAERMILVLKRSPGQESALEVF